MPSEKICIVGVGPGSAEYVTRSAMGALSEAEYLVGSPRVLDALPGDFAGERIALPTSGMSAAVVEVLERCAAKGRTALVVSGDPGFYSLGRKVTEAFGSGAVRIIPGISSLQLLASRIGRSWVNVRSATMHGRELSMTPEEVAESVGRFPALVVMLGEAKTVKSQLEWLCDEAGLGGAWAAIGWDLGLPGEQVFTSTTLSGLRANPYTGRLAILWLEKGSDD